jgi:toxin YoeB
MWEVYYRKQAKKDSNKLFSAGLKSKAKNLLEVIEKNPY